MNSYTTLSAAYQRVLYDLLHWPQYKCQPRGQEIVEITNYQISVRQPTYQLPIVTADRARNEIIARYTSSELSLYESRTRNVEDFAIASSFWRKVANPDGTINSAYGQLIWEREICGNAKFNDTIRTPWKWAIQSLINDKDSRQAVVHFNTPDFLWEGNRDVVCTMHGQFLIRNDQLHLRITMRSNDAVKGFVYDVIWFSSLIHQALLELRPFYPYLQLGTYTHDAGSMHLYAKDITVVKEMLVPILRQPLPGSRPSSAEFEQLLPASMLNRGS